MLNQIKIIEFLISVESIFISSMLPIYMSLPSNKKLIEIIDIPITLQIPFIIFLTIIFSGGIVYKAYTTYILIGLFILPVFFDGGSLGYILTPNFGYLIGVYFLISTINKLNKKRVFSIKQYFKLSILALISMHLIGILFNSIQLLLFNKLNLLPYIIGKYTLSKIIFEIILLFPILILIKPFKKLNSL